jgi:plastocyanin
MIGVLEALSLWGCEQPTPSKRMGFSDDINKCLTDYYYRICQNIHINYYRKENQVKKKSFVVFGLVITAVLLITACAPSPVMEESAVEEVMPSVEVSDQAIENSMVTVDLVVSSGPGWIVIHADNEGAPGPVIGYSAVQDGMNVNVNVDIDEDAANDMLFAMLHTDAGVEGVYEFPGEDAPVMADGNVVMTPFSVATAMEEPAASAEVNVPMINFKYDPVELTVSAGTTVTWTNEDNVMHTVTSGLRGNPTGVFDEAVEPGGTFSFTFDETGTFDYFCIPHPGMDGTIIVE